MLVHVQHVLPVRRKKREQRRAKEPEPGHSEGCAPHGRIGSSVAAHANRLSHRVPIESKSGIARRRIGYSTTHEKSHAGDDQHESRGHRRGKTRLHEESTAHAAEKNRKKRRRPDKSVSGDERVLAQRLRKDGVFHRAEERRLRSHEEQSTREEPRVVREKSHRRNSHDRNFPELDPTNEPRLFELVRELAGRRREQEERENEEPVEHRRPQRSVSGLGEDPESNKEDKRRLEQVVVQRAEKLGPKQWAEAALAQ